MQMRIRTTIAALLLSGAMASAQTADPAVMTINGQPVPLSEFEYSYNKNNSEGVIDKKTVEEYVDLFINYKLKVVAALDAHLDTLQSFQREFATYRDQQVRPAIITDEDVEEEAKKIYASTKHRIDSLGGLFQPAHILIRVEQQATEAERKAAQQRIDSIYTALKGGADFAEMARKHSQDPGTAAKGGMLPWLTKGQTLKEFEDVALSLKAGETSTPFLSYVGYHIVQMKGRKSLEPYDSLRANIMQFIDTRNIRESIIDNKLKTIAMAKANGSTPQTLLAAKEKEMEEADPAFKYLIKEYYDGLLLFEISNRTVWEKASKDEAGLKEYFAQNKKKYTWTAPRFKGISYNVKSKADLAAVKKSVKGLSFDKWAERLRTTFNNDSVIRVRVKKGLFRQGDDALVDKVIFKRDTTVTPMKDYPYSSVFGKKLKAPEEMDDVRGLVTADYQEKLEKEWVADLRKKYTVVVNRDVLATVNKHK